MRSSIRKFIAAVSIALFLISAVLPAEIASAYNIKPKFIVNDRYSVSNVYSGFELVSKEQIDNIQSTAMVFNHVKTGAKLIYLKNSDKEKSFGIGFKTPAADNTGVNHIIEHSVLCGSENYPVKSPFLEMSKQSLNTFINALTFDDFTLYPVASKSEKDLKNLMSVYLDAVFLPNIYKDSNIFKQEGWRYELESKDSELKLNGIIYNEMKGATSSPMSVMQDAIKESLFPDTSYRWNSGGDPADIPNLTYSNYINTYKKYYSPSNSYIFLYGDLDIDGALKFIDENYLSKLKSEYVDSSLVLQNSFDKRKEVVVPYGISRDGDTKNKTYLTLNFVTGKTSDKEQDMAMSFLANLLMGLDSSPLKKALSENKVAQNVYCTYNDYGLQPTFSIIAENTEEENKQKFEKVVNDTLEKIVFNGFDRELIKSLFNYYELAYRMSKQSTSKGIYQNIAAMKGWVFGGNPALYLDNEGTINKMKNSINNGYFEKLIKDYLISNRHSSLVILKPEKGLIEKNASNLKEKLNIYKSSLGDKEIDALIRDTQEFKKWQEAPDSKEALLKIPRLSRSDLDQRAEELAVLEKEQDGMKIVINNFSTGGISNVALYFDASKVPQEKLHYLSLLTLLLGKTDTKKYDYSKLSNEIIMNTGGIGFTLMPYARYKDPSSYQPKVVMFTTALDDNMPAALGLGEEILNNSIFTNKERFIQIIEETKANMEAMYTANPGILASGGIMANLSESGKFGDFVLGLSYYKFMCDITRDIDSNFDEIVKNLEEVKNLTFNKEGLIVGFTGDESGYTRFQESMGILTGKINKSTAVSYKYKFDAPVEKQAFSLPVKTMDVMKGGNFKKAGYEYSGKMKVLEKILNSGYMWQQIRVKGGAYGGSMSISDDGNIIFMSYRDPNLKQTLGAYDSVVEYLKNFDASEDEMTNYIIGTIGSMDWNLNPMIKGILGTMRFLSGVTQQDLQRERDQILSTTAQDIRNYADMIDKTLKQDIYSVAGDENVIKENAGMFNRIQKVSGQ